MSKFRNIVICGDVGTGTTTLAKTLAEKLGWQYLSVGSFFREYLKSHGLELWDKMSVPEEVERKIDTEMQVKLKEENGLVVEGHYLGWFTKDLPNVLRILLVCDKETATKRILDRQNPDDGTAEDIEKRRQTLRLKFKKLYSDENYDDPDIYHLIIDTDKNSMEQTFELAFQKFQES